MIIDTEEEKVEEVQNQEMTSRNQPPWEQEKEQTYDKGNTPSSSDGVHNINNRYPTTTQSSTPTAGQRNVSFSEAVNSHS
jgi:hypothetical protein